MLWSGIGERDLTAVLLNIFAIEQHKKNNFILVSPDIFAMDHHKETELDHVPAGTAIVVHQVESHGYMRVAVITAEVVLENIEKYIV